MDPQRIQRITERLVAFVDRFRSCLGRVERRACCRTYLAGLLLDGERKSVQPLAARLPGSNYQALQQFVTDSPWDPERLMDTLAAVMTESLSPQGGVLVIDDTSLPKKGTHSVGVARQYCGALGKIANCQALVSIHYAGAEVHFPLNAELYLPKAWTEDEARMAKARVPKEKRAFREKGPIALSLLDRVRGTVPHQAVVMDSAYGDSRDFLGALDARDEPFIAQISGELSFWPAAVKTAAVSRAARGRRLKHPVVADARQRPLSARGWGEALMRERPAGHTVTLPLGRPRTVSVWAQRVREADAQGRRRPGKERWLLIERAGEDRIAWYVSNLPPQTPVETLVALAHKRWTVEQGYQQLKEELGLDHFEGRSWPGLHHHVALCFMAFGFLLLLRKEGGGKNEADESAGREAVRKRPAPDHGLSPMRHAHPGPTMGLPGMG